MMKEVARAMESGILPEIGLLAFIFAFTLVIIWALMMKKDQRETAKHIPLDDPDRVVLPTNNHPANHHV